MKEISLSRGMVCLVDDDDFVFLSKFKWYAKKSRNNFYAARTDNLNNHKTIFMHRVILNINDSTVICDHKNLNSLDNRKENLRLCTAGENRLNCKARKDSKTGIKGVFNLKNTKNFYAQIRIKGEIIPLGSFEKVEDATKAYNNAAIKYHGEFAQLN